MIPKTQQRTTKRKLGYLKFSKDKTEMHFQEHLDCKTGVDQLKPLSNS